MPFVGQTVPHRHAGVLGEDLHRLVRKPTKLNSIKHPTQHPGGVRHRLLLAELDVILAQVLRVGPLVDAGDREGTAGPRRGLLKEKGDVQPFERLMADPRVFLGLEIRGQGQKLPNFIRREVEQLEE